MTKQTGTFISRERVVLDGIAYNINVYLGTGTYRATWYCGACSQRSKMAFEHGAIGVATSMCKRDLAIHCGQAHSKS